MTNETNNYANAIHFNHKNRTIEITKKFDEASSRFGTDEFRRLQEAVDFAPQYKVVVKTTKAKDAFKGLTYEFMESYIEKKEGKDSTVMTEYRGHRGYIEGNDEQVFDSLTYGEIRAWFLALYPELEDFIDNRKKKIDKAKKARLSRKQTA